MVFSSKFGHGGARANSGGPRENSGGYRPGSGRKPAPVVVAPALPALDTPDHAPRWYVIRTEYGLEKLADTELRLAGFAVFAPMLWRPAVMARREGRYIRPARPAKVEFLFPRYVLVRFSRADPWQDIRHLPGVDCILGTAPDHPIAVPDAAVDTIRGRLINDCAYPPNSNLADLDAALPLDPGITARVLSGPMADLSGICQWSTAARVGLLMDLLGRPVAVTVERENVEAV